MKQSQPKQSHRGRKPISAVLLPNQKGLSSKLDAYFVVISGCLKIIAQYRDFFISVKAAHIHSVCKAISDFSDSLKVAQTGWPYEAQAIRNAALVQKTKLSRSVYGAENSRSHWLCLSASGPGHIPFK